MSSKFLEQFAWVFHFSQYYEYFHKQVRQVLVQSRYGVWLQIWYNWNWK